MTALDALKCLQRSTEELSIEYYKTEQQAPINTWINGFYRGSKDRAMYIEQRLQEIIKEFEHEQAEATAAKEDS